MENESKQAKVENKPPVDPNQVVFWSRAKKARLANYVPEIKSDRGTVVRREDSIRFYEHMRITKNPKEIEFIRGHNAFESGDVIECADGVQEANARTVRHDQQKYAVTEEKAVYVGKEQVVEKR